MIEPTETESKETLDAFCDAMIQIAREAETIPDAIHEAPVTTPVRRLDQTKAAREPESALEPGAGRVTAGARWRLLVTEPTDGATNMAIDEALWRGRQAGDVAAHAALLRLGAARRCRSATASRSTRDVDLAACRALGVGLVRRPTGRQRDLPRRPRARADLQRGGDGRRPRRRRRPARDLPVDRRARSLRGLRALGAPAELVPERRARDGPTPAFCFARTGRYEIEVGGPQARGQRAAPPGRLVPPARLRPARRRRAAAARRCSRPRAIRWPR